MLYGTKIGDETLITHADTLDEFQSLPSSTDVRSPSLMDKMTYPELMSFNNSVYILNNNNLKVELLSLLKAKDGSTRMKEKKDAFEYRNDNTVLRDALGLTHKVEVDYDYGIIKKDITNPRPWHGNKICPFHTWKESIKSSTATEYVALVKEQMVYIYSKDNPSWICEVDLCIDHIMGEKFLFAGNNVYIYKGIGTDGLIENINQLGIDIINKNPIPKQIILPGSDKWSPAIGYDDVQPTHLSYYAIERDDNTTLLAIFPNNSFRTEHVDFTSIIGDFIQKSSHPGEYTSSLNINVLKLILNNLGIAESEKAIKNHLKSHGSKEFKEALIVALHNEQFAPSERDVNILINIVFPHAKKEAYKTLGIVQTLLKNGMDVNEVRSKLETIGYSGIELDILAPTSDKECQERLFNLISPSEIPTPTGKSDIHKIEKEYGPYNTFLENISTTNPLISFYDYLSGNKYDEDKSSSVIYNQHKEDLIAIPLLNSNYTIRNLHNLNEISKQDCDGVKLVYYKKINPTHPAAAHVIIISSILGNQDNHYWHQLHYWY